VKNDPAHPDPRGLTTREREVSEFVGLGRSTKEISYTLGVSFSAITNLTTQTQAKLGLSSRAELAAFFGAKCDFAARVDELTLTRETKDMVVVSSDPYLNNLLVANCEEALSRRRASRGSFRSAVENAIVPLLPHGKAHAADVALRLGVSQRTSARRLSLEGLTFSEVLDSLRCDLARRYLADEKLSISRIAWLLGFQEVSSFTNAFKRWTGTTPRQARASLLGFEPVGP
jgi:AraC-like DNA-binding protein/DNA-binding CsgD family transcriptional regulator